MVFVHFYLPFFFFFRSSPFYKKEYWVSFRYTYFFCLFCRFVLKKKDRISIFRFYLSCFLFFRSSHHALQNASLNKYSLYLPFFLSFLVPVVLQKAKVSICSFLLTFF